MSSTKANAVLPPNFMLTPQQQSLLFAALNSNKGNSQSPANNAMTLSPTSLTQSPAQNDSFAGFDSPYLDNYDYDYGDTSFDFDFSNDTNAKMIGDLPGTAKSDSAEGETDKRAHPDDDEEESGNENGAKRRESTEKVAKKPGRKPLTSEPTTVRHPTI
jgi:AP-1-like factor